MRSRKQDAGFSLIELLMVVAIGIILTAVAIPSLRMTDRMRAESAARDVQQELNAARLCAVGANRRLEVRFNCPSPGTYRIVEAGWADSGRCDPVAYPYPAPSDAAYRVPARPRHDGPVRRLATRVSLAASAPVLQFAPNGRATKLEAGTSKLIATETVTVTIGSFSRTIEVNGMGKALIR